MIDLTTIKQFVVKKIKENPFDKKGVYMQNHWMLCYNDEVIADIESQEANYLTEGLVLLREDVILSPINKRSKHLVVGDKVLFGEMKCYEGTIHYIEDVSDEFWDDNFHLENCCISSNFLTGHVPQPPQKTVVQRRYAEHISYLQAEIANPYFSVKRYTEYDFNLMKTNFTESYETDALPFGMLLSEAMREHNVEEIPNFSKIILKEVLADNYYPNSIPVMYLRDIIKHFKIDLHKAILGLRITFNMLLIKQPRENAHEFLWKNKESLQKYIDILIKLLK